MIEGVPSSLSQSSFLWCLPLVLERPMQWSEELNALLNQCVFASSYDFEAASELFCAQAATRRLWGGHGTPTLTANQCQEQWMNLNPAEEDDEWDELDGEGDPEDQAGHHSREEASRAMTAMQLDDDNVESRIRAQELESLEESEETVVLDGGPRLELSLTDAELDLLLSALPPHQGQSPEVDDFTSAEAKSAQHPVSGRSEMQWVLDFLKDPDAAVPVDVEAKNLAASPEKHDDDNYQVFLEGLQEANLMLPVPPSLGESLLPPVPSRAKTRQLAASTTASDDDDDDDDDEWERTRQAIKAGRV